MTKSVLSWILGAVATVALLAGSFWWWRGYMNISEIGEYNSLSEPYGSMASAASTTIRGGIPIATATVPNATVISIIDSLPNGSSFQAFLQASGVNKKLTGRGPYMVFVATDGAFSHLPQGALVSMTQSELQRLVEYHIVAGRTIDLATVATTSLVALSKDIIPVVSNVADHAAQVGDGWVLQEFKATNGIVYTVSAVLLPPSKP
jgi:uncharacterized surface protein with fasciclin (FAS1) repeats